MHHRLLLRLTTQSNNPLLRSVPRLPLQSNWPQLQKLQQQQPHRRLLFSKSTKDDSNPKSFKNLIKQHGPAAVLTYAALAGVSYVCFYIAIVASGIDPLQLMHKLPFQNHSVEASQKTEEVKKDQTVVGAMEDAVMSGIHGMEAAMAKGSENVGDIIGVGVETVDAMFHDEKKVVVGVSGGLSIQGNLESSTVVAKPYFNGTTALVAFCVHELFMPIRLGLTAWLTPKVSARMKGGVIDRFLTRIMARFGGAATNVSKEESDVVLKGKMMNVREQGGSKKQ